MKSYHNRRARVAQTIRNEEETRILLNPDFICRMETHAEHCATKTHLWPKGRRLFSQSFIINPSRPGNRPTSPAKS